MTDAFRFFLECINLFFIIYLIGYSSFLFLSVVAGAIELYKSYRLEQDVYKRQDLYSTITQINVNRIARYF